MYLRYAYRYAKKDLSTFDPNFRFFFWQDLRERLWDICDTRKEQIEEERNNLIAEGWIEDHLGILANHYLTLMQVGVSPT